MNDVTLRACPVVDELVTDEGSLVLVGAAGGHRVVRLSVLGQLIRELAEEEISLERLIEELEVALGPAEGGDARDLVLSAVVALAEDGVIDTTPEGLLARNVRNAES